MALAVHADTRFRVWAKAWANRKAGENRREEEKENAEASETQSGKRSRVHADGTARRRHHRRDPGGCRRAALPRLRPRLAARRGEGVGGLRADGGASPGPAENAERRRELHEGDRNSVGSGR